MPRTSSNIRIPLSGDVAVLLGRVKPTIGMPRPGDHKPKQNPKKKTNANRAK